MLWTPILVFDNDYPARFATVHSAYYRKGHDKLLTNILPTATIILTTHTCILNGSVTCKNKSSVVLVVIPYVIVVMLLGKSYLTGLLMEMKFDGMLIL